MKDQELHKAAEKATDVDGLDWENVYAREKFIEGAKWQAERMYSKKEVLEILDHHTSYLETFIYQYIDRHDMEVNRDWFEQFKK